MDRNTNLFNIFYLYITKVNMSFIQAYHDKELNKYGLLKENKLPLFDNESYNNILITRDRIYHFQTQDIKKTISLKIFLKKWKAFKDVLTTLFTHLGIFSGSYLILNIDTISQEYNTLLSILFWISIIISMDIWKSLIIHEKKEIYESRESEPLEQDLILLMQNELNFSRYEFKSPIKNIDTEIFELLAQCSNDKEIDIYRILIELSKKREVQEYLSLLEISTDLITNNLDLNEVNFPEYKLSVLRSLFIYSLEEELMRNKTNVNYISFFIALYRVFPTLQNIFNKEDIYIEELRNAYIYFYELKEYQSQCTNKRSRTNIPLISSKDYFIKYHNIYDKKNYLLAHPKIISEILSRIKSGVSTNFVLLGESGVGKTGIIKGLTQTLSANNNYICLLINHEMKYPKTKFKEYLKSLDPLKRYIFFLEDIKFLIENEDIYLTIKEIQDTKKIFFVITGNNVDYLILQEKIPNIEVDFNEIEIPVINEESTKKILINEIAINFTNVKISSKTIDLLVEYSGKYSTVRRHPDSAISLLYEIYNWGEKPQSIDKNLVYKYMSVKTGLSIKDLSDMSKTITTIKDLEKKLNEEVYGQEEAISSLLQSFDINNPKILLLIGQEGSGRKFLLEKFAFIQNKTLLPINTKKLNKKNTKDVMYYYEINNETSQSLIESVIQIASEQNIHLFIISNVGEKEINDYILHNEILWEETNNFVIIENRQKIGISFFPLISSIIVFKPVTPEILEKIALNFLSDIAHTTAQKNILLTWDNNFPQRLIASLGVNNLNINNLHTLFNTNISPKIMSLLYKHSNSIKKIHLDETWLNI